METKPQGILGGLIPHLGTRSYADQLSFWESFRKQHRERVANTEAQLCPELFTEVDKQIARLKPMAATGGVK